MNPDNFQYLTETEDTESRKAGVCSALFDFITEVNHALAGCEARQVDLVAQKLQEAKGLMYRAIEDAYGTPVTEAP